MLKKINKTYYFRYKVPQELNDVFYTKEILRSLKTEKKSYAIILHDIFISEIHKINLLARSNMISHEKLKDLALEFKRKKLNEISIDIDKHPNPKKTLMHQFNSYDDEKERNNNFNFSSIFCMSFKDSLITGSKSVFSILNFHQCLFIFY